MYETEKALAQAAATANGSAREGEHIHIMQEHAHAACSGTCGEVHDHVHTLSVCAPELHCGPCLGSDILDVVTIPWIRPPPGRWCLIITHARLDGLQTSPTKEVAVRLWAQGAEVVSEELLAGRCVLRPRKREKSAADQRGVFSVCEDRRGCPNYRRANEVIAFEAS
ncbi:hypothetical protein FKP32DRAFT_1284832 [Trametes sanguinea]|nr:hypothetical protein FKP32DRAFT_1284832 [Trametes sanguinea]